MAVLTQKTGEPFCEVIRVTMEGTTSINLMSLQPGTIVERVVVRVIAAATGTAMNLAVGDADNTAGYIAAVDAQSVAGTVIGDDPTERGAYMYDATKKGDFAKLYSAAGKYLSIFGSAAGTGGTYDVVVYGQHIEV